MAKKNLKLTRYSEIEALFADCGWGDMENPTYNQRFINFCVSFGQLEEREFQLIKELTRRFHTMTIVELVEEFLTGYYSIPDGLIQGCQHLLIVPMKQMKKNGDCVHKQKSGDMLLAQMEQVQDTCCYHEKFLYCNNATELSNIYSPGDLVCFIDDYVGTGKTFIKAYQTTSTYLSSLGIQLQANDVIGVSAWAMKEGISKCNEAGLRLYCYRVFNKEITDYYPSPVNIEHKVRMLKIESKLCKKLTEEYQLGYGHSEALVSIGGRCANNTFPVYWKKTNATFPR